MTAVEIQRPDEHVFDGSPPEQEFLPDPRVAVLQDEKADATARQEAFAAIVREFEGPLQGYAANIVGSGEAEDAVQETFLRAFTRIGEFETRSEGALSSWLYTITRNAALNMKRWRKGQHIQDVAPAPGGSEPAALANAHSRIGDPERRQEFVDRIAMLGRLLASDREALVLGASGYSPAEIAEMKGTTTQAIKSRMWRGRQALRQMEEAA